MKNKNSSIIFITGSIVVGICLFLLFGNSTDNCTPCEVCEECKDDFDIALVESGIKDISRLCTAQYYFSKEELYKNSKEFETSFKFVSDVIEWATEKSYTCIYTGYVNAYVEFGNIEVTQFLDKITIRVPHAELEETNIVDFDFKDEKDSIFNKLDENYKEQMIRDLKVIEQENAIECKLLEKAEENAEIQIKNLLNMFGNKIKKYEVEIKFY